MQDKRKSAIARSLPAMPTSLGCELNPGLAFVCPGSGWNLALQQAVCVFFGGGRKGEKKPSSCVDAGPAARQLLEEPAGGN